MALIDDITLRTAAPTHTSCMGPKLSLRTTSTRGRRRLSLLLRDWPLARDWLLAHDTLSSSGRAAVDSVELKVDHDAVAAALAKLPAKPAALAVTMSVGDGGARGSVLSPAEVSVASPAGGFSSANAGSGGGGGGGGVSNIRASPTGAVVSTALGVRSVVSQWSLMSTMAAVATAVVAGLDLAGTAFAVVAVPAAATAAEIGVAGAVDSSAMAAPFPASATLATWGSFCASVGGVAGGSRGLWLMGTRLMVLTSISAGSCLTATPPVAANAGGNADEAATAHEAEADWRWGFGGEDCAKRGEGGALNNAIHSGPSSGFLPRRLRLPRQQESAGQCCPKQHCWQYCHYPAIWTAWLKSALRPICRQQQWVCWSNLPRTACGARRQYLPSVSQLPAVSAQTAGPLPLAARDERA